MDRQNLLAIVCIAAATASALAGIISEFMLSAILLAICIVSFIALRLHIIKNSTIYRQVIILIESMLSRRTAGSTVRLLEMSNSPDFGFHKELSHAIMAYRLSYDTEPFTRLSAYGSYALTRFSSIVVSGLEMGHEIIPSLERLKASLQSEDRQKRRSVMQIRNAVSLSRIGPMLFFPIFAGITTNIMKFASVAVQSQPFPQITPILSLYILAANVSGFENSRISDLEFLCDAALASAIGLFIFRASSLLSAIMLR